MPALSSYVFTLFLMLVATATACNSEPLCPRGEPVTDGNGDLVSCDPAGPQPYWRWATDASEVTDAATSLFGQDEPAQIHLTLDQARWDYLTDNAIELDTEGIFSSTNVNINGQDIGTVGIRVKGSLGTLRNCFDAEGKQTCAKLSYKLKFSEFDKDKRFVGLSRLNLHSAIRDASLMRDYMGYGLHRRMGSAAPRVGYAELFVNDEPYGLYLMIEQVDQSFLESRFPGASTGNLYKDVWPSGTGGKRYEVRLKTNKKKPDHTAITAFKAQLAAASDHALPGVLDKWLHGPRFDSFTAVDQAIGNWDGPLSFVLAPSGSGSHVSHNFYLYQDAAEHFVFIPWDMDHSFETWHRHYKRMPDYRDLSIDCEHNGSVRSDNDTRDVLIPTCDPLTRALALSRHRDATQRLADGPFSMPQMSKLIDWNERRLTDAVDRDPHLEVERWRMGIDSFRRDLEYHVARLRD